MFAFPKPGNESKTILILNFHPSEGLNPKGPTTTVPFAANALYELMIDTDGDHVANIAYSVRFAESPDGKQTATLRRIDGSTERHRFATVRMERSFFKARPFRLAARLRSLMWATIDFLQVGAATRSFSIH
jgi:hypothetical protein